MSKNNPNKKKKKPVTKESAGKSHQDEKRKPVKSRAKIEYSFRDARFRALSILALSLLIFIFIWIQPDASGFQDPWYKAIQLVDSSRKVTDPKIKQELLDEGGSMLKKLAREHPYHARVHHLLGVYYAFTKQWGKAAEQQEKAIEIGSGGLVNNVEFDSQRDLISAYFNIGNEFIKNSKTDSAIAYYKKAIDWCSKSRQTRPVAELNQAASKNLSIALTQKGNDAAKSNNPDKALEYYKDALSYFPNNAEAHNNIGIIYSRMNQLQKAHDHFEKAITINPDYKSALNNLKATIELMKHQGK